MEDAPRRFSELSNISKVLVGIVLFAGTIAHGETFAVGIGQIVGASVVSGVIALFIALIDLIFSRRFRLNLNVWAVGTFIIYVMAKDSSSMLQ